MPPISEVRIWYANTVETDWETSPDEGVQIVAWIHDGGGVTWSWGVDTYTLPGSSRVKTGATINTGKFNKLLSDAQAQIAAMGVL